MKKLYILLLFMGCLFVMTSCSDNDQTIPDSPLRIVKSNLVFTATGGSGAVTVTSDTPITSAESSDDWCKVAITSDTTINVTVNPYIGNDTRNARITIKDGKSNAVNIVASQSGDLFYLGSNMLNVSDAASSTSIKMKHAYPATATTSADWINVSIEGDSLKFSFAENNTDNVRSAMVYVESSDKKDSVFVTQCDIADIVGEYYFLGYNSSGNLIYLNSTLEDNKDGSLTLAFPDLKFSTDVEYDKSTATFHIYGGSYLGTANITNTTTGVTTTRYIFVDLWDSAAGYLTWNTACSFNCRFYGEDKSTVGSFEDNGSWSGYTVNSLIFDEFTSQAASSSTRVGTTYFRILYPYMIKKSKV